MKLKINIKNVIIFLGARLVQLILPYFCLKCGKNIQFDVGLCETCFNKIKFVREPFCHHCGRPLSNAEREWKTCLFCMKNPKTMLARFVLCYDEESKPLILAVKHADKTDIIPYMGRQMLYAGKDVIAKADVIVPVPLHKLRLIKRKYNQAALLASYIARKSKKSLVPNALKRTKKTNSQGQKSKKERMLNVKNAFDVKNLKVFKDKKVLLVDDVVTTGATVKECKKALLKAGAKEVMVLAFAVVVKT